MRPFTQCESPNMKRINMKIGASGASGHLGRATVAELVQRPAGHDVVAISRTPETITALAQGAVWGPQPAGKPCGGLCGSRSSAHHPGPGTRKARGAERRCNRRGGEGALTFDARRTRLATMVRCFSIGF